MQDDFEDDLYSFRVRRRMQLEHRSRALTPAQRMIRAACWFIAPFALAFAVAVLFAIGAALVEANAAEVSSQKSSVSISALICQTPKQYRAWVVAARASAFPLPGGCSFADSGPEVDPRIVAVLGRVKEPSLQDTIYHVVIETGGSMTWNNPGSSSGQWIRQPVRKITGWVSCGQVHPDRTLGNNAC